MRNADGCDVMMNRVMTKDNIALAVLLETREAAWETLPAQPDQVLLRNMSILDHD
jgi:hypothetical protein